MGRRAQEDGLSVNLSGGNVIITAEQFREYKELQAKRDRTIQSMRAQQTLQESETRKFALRLAHEVNGALLCGGKMGVAIVNNRAAANAVELANELLATE